MAKNDIVYRLSGEDKLSPAIKNAKKEIDSMADKAKRVDELKDSFNRLNESNAPLGVKISKTKKYLQELAAQGQENSEVFKQMAKSVAEYQSKLANVDVAIKDAKKELEGFSLKGGITDIASEMGLGGVGKALGALATPTGAAVAGVALLGKTMIDAAKKANEFEVSLDSLQALTGLADEDMPKLQDNVLKLSKTYGQAATDIADAMGLIGSQAPELLKNQDALAGVTEAALILAKVGDMDVSSAAKAITSTMNQFGVAASEASNIINTMAAASQQGSADVNYLTEVINKAGSVAKNSGMDYTQLIAMTEAVAGKFPEAAVAGTQMQGVLLSLSKNGIEPTVEGLQKLKDQNLSTEEAMKLVGQGNVRMLNAMLDGIEAFDGYSQSIAGTEAALDQYAIKTDNFNSRMERFSATWDAFLIKLGQSEMVNGLMDAFEELCALGQELFEWVEELIGIFSNMDAPIDSTWQLRNAWEGLKQALEIVMTTIKVLSALFVKVVNAISDGARWLGDKVKGYWDGAKQSLMDIAFVRAIIQGFQKVLEAANKMIAKIKGWWNDFLKWLGIETKSVGQNAVGDLMKEAGATTIGTGDTVEDNSSPNGGGSHSTSTNKGNKKKEKVFDENSLAYAEQQLQKANQALKEVNQNDAEAIQAAEDLVKKWEEIVKVRKKALEISKNDNGSLDFANKKLAEYTKLLNETDINSPEFKEYQTQQKNWQNEVNIRKLAFDVDDNSLQYIQKKISELTKKKNEINLDDTEAIAKINEDLKKAREEEQRRKFKLTFEADSSLINTINEVDSRIKELTELKNMPWLDPTQYEAVKKQLEDMVNLKKQMTQQEAMEQFNTVFNSSGASQKEIEARMSFLQNFIVSFNLDPQSLQKAKDEILSLGKDLENKKLDNSIVDPIDLMANRASAAGSALATLGGSLQKLGKDSAAAKIGLIASAIGQIVVGFATASASPAVTATGWGWLGYLTAGLAAVGTAIATIQSFDSGGIVQPSSRGTLHGDTLLARVNVGEAIINTKQQNRMMELLNSPSYGEGRGLQGDVNFKIRADYLYGVLENRTKRLNKLG